MGEQHRDRATADTRAHGIGAAREDDGHARAEHDARRFRAREKGELLGEHVARFEVGHEQDVGVARDWRRDALDARGFGADRVVEGERAVEQAAGDLAAVGHLAERGGVDRRGHLVGDRFHGREDRHLRRADAERLHEIDGVAHDVGLVGELGEDVDGRVGDEERLVIRGHVHREHVREAALGAQAVRARSHFVQQFVGVQAALHEQFGLARAHGVHGALGGGMAVRGVDDHDVVEREIRLLRHRADLLFGAD
ncbi:hypothetical protein PT2222_10312 [Paraburkholderia tropica]